MRGAACFLAVALTAAAFSRPARADPGFVWVRGVGDKVLERRQKGESRVGQGAVIQTDTPFNLASLSKPFTAYLVWLLAREHHLSLETPLRTVFPELPAAYGAVRILDLLHHASGIPDYTSVCDGTAGSPKRAKDVILNLRKLEFRPGSRFEYSNSNYLILAWLAKRLSGMEFPQALRSRVLEPAGMSHAYLRTELPVGRDKGVAWAYSADPAGRLVLNTADPCDSLSGDGGLVASADDLVAWARYLDAHLSHPKDALWDLFASGTHGLPGSEAFEYGLGWQLMKDGSGKYFQHAGGWLGYRSLFRYRPGSRKWLVLLANRDDVDVYSLADAIESGGRSPSVK